MTSLNGRATTIGRVVVPFKTAFITPGFGCVFPNDQIAAMLAAQGARPPAGAVFHVVVPPDGNCSNATNIVLVDPATGVEFPGQRDQNNHYKPITQNGLYIAISQKDIPAPVPVPVSVGSHHFQDGVPTIIQGAFEGSNGTIGCLMKTGVSTFGYGSSESCVEVVPLQNPNSTWQLWVMGEDGDGFSGCLANGSGVDLVLDVHCTGDVNFANEDTISAGPMGVATTVAAGGTTGGDSRFRLKTSGSGKCLTQRDGASRFEPCDAASAKLQQWLDGEKAVTPRSAKAPGTPRSDRDAIVHAFLKYTPDPQDLAMLNGECGGFGVMLNPKYWDPITQTKKSLFVEEVILYVEGKCPNKPPSPVTKVSICKIPKPSPLNWGSRPPEAHLPIQSFLPSVTGGYTLTIGTPSGVPATTIACAQTNGENGDGKSQDEDTVDTPKGKNTLLDAAARKAAKEFERLKKKWPKQLPEATNCKEIAEKIRNLIGGKVGQTVNRLGLRSDGTMNWSFRLGPSTNDPLGGWRDHWFVGCSRSSGVGRVGGIRVGSRSPGESAGV